jgi:glycosyltransferase involved in cell wall biosynthesis
MAPIGALTEFITASGQVVIIVIAVLFIAYHFPPGGGAGVQRSQKFVHYLPFEGFSPIVVTGPAASGDRWTPRDEALPDESSAGIQVIRAVGPIPQNKGRWSDRVGRWLGSRSLFSRWWIKAATEVAFQSRADAKLIFATMSPFASGDVAREISRRTGIPWIADLRDPWALDEMQIYPSKIHQRVELRRMEKLLSGAAGIVMNTPEAAAALREAFPTLKDKPLATITNGYDAADFSKEADVRTDGKFRIVHTGYLHTDLGLQLRRKRNLYQLLGGVVTGVDILTRSHVFLLEAIQQWMARRSEIAQDLEIVFAGVTSDRDRDVAMKSKISSFIRFTGYISHLESVRLIRSADLLFLPMHNLPVGRRSRIVPGKTYEYMATGGPILAAVPEGDARDFLEKSGVAFLTKPDDVEGMIEQLDRVYLAWKSGTCIISQDRKFISTFDRLKLTHRLASFFDQVLENSNGGQASSRALEAGTLKLK